MHSSATILRSDSPHLRALRALAVAGNAPGSIFDALASAAAVVCEVPIAQVILRNEHRVSHVGSFGVPNIRLATLPCVFFAHMLASGKSLLVPNASQDTRFADDVLVAGPADIQFFAGVPIRVGSRETLGVLCVADHVPRRLASHQFRTLRRLANLVTTGLGSHDTTGEDTDETPWAGDLDPTVDDGVSITLESIASRLRVTRIEHRYRRVLEPPYDLPNPNLLALDDRAEVQLWADDLSISTQRLREIVAKVGPMRAAVHGYVKAQRIAAAQVGESSDND